MKTLGEKLKELRIEQGLTHFELAQKLGFKSGSTVGMYEAEQRKPSAETLNKLANIFGVSVDYLLGQNNNLDDLEQTFPKGVRMLRRANNQMTEKQKEKLVKYIEFLLEDED